VPQGRANLGIGTLAGGKAPAEAIAKWLYVHIYVHIREAAMTHVSYTELRAHLAKYMDEVCDSRAPLYVTRQNARSVVMISADEYEGMLETLHLLRNPANAARLLQSISEADAGQLSEHELIEPAPAEK
jgi:antitoxin YefM